MSNTETTGALLLLGLFGLAGLAVAVVAFRSLKKILQKERERKAAMAYREEQAVTDVEETNEPRSELPETLTYCPDCGNVISKMAMTCPHCGRPLREEPERDERPASGTNGNGTGRNGTSAFGVFVAVVLAGLVLWYMVAPYTTPTWMQHIGGTIKAVLSGEDSYKIIDWDKYGK